MRVACCLLNKKGASHQVPAPHAKRCALAVRITLLALSLIAIILGMVFYETNNDFFWLSVSGGATLLTMLLEWAISSVCGKRTRTPFERSSKARPVVASDAQRKEMLEQLRLQKSFVKEDIASQILAKCEQVEKYSDQIHTFRTFLSSKNLTLDAVVDPENHTVLHWIAVSENSIVWDYFAHERANDFEKAVQVKSTDGQTPVDLYSPPLSASPSVAKTPFTQFTREHEAPFQALLSKPDDRFNNINNFLNTNNYNLETRLSSGYTVLHVITSYQDYELLKAFSEAHPVEFNKVKELKNNMERTPWGEYRFLRSIAFEKEDARIMALLKPSFINRLF